jgi:hypothetical protein
MGKVAISEDPLPPLLGRKQLVKSLVVRNPSKSYGKSCNFRRSSPSLFKTKILTLDALSLIV